MRSVEQLESNFLIYLKIKVYVLNITFNCLSLRYNVGKKRKHNNMH